MISIVFYLAYKYHRYTQMQIDNYVEKVERAMDKIAQLNFVAVNSQGARISLRNKAEMEVRYQDMLSDLKELKNEQFVVVSQHRDSSLRCACWQGLIYLKDTDGTDVSLKNWHEWNNVNNHITPKPIGYTENNQPYYSLKEAMEHGLFSYNCRHRFIKYEPGAKVPKQYPYNPNKESTSSLIDKEMRQMEQNIRRAKERQTLALTPKERKKWQVKSKKLQAQYDEFCKKHNRVRNDWRTSIGIVERGHMKNVENKTEAPYIKPKYDESGVFNAKTIKLVEGIEKQISKFLDRGYSKKDLKEAKLYKNIPEDLKTNFENLLEGIVGNTNANGDGLKNATLYFGKGDKSKNREGSAEHILTDHIDQIDYKFIIHLNATIKNNHFTEVTTSNGNERHESIYEFKNDEGKKRYFIIIADKDEKSDLRIVTAFIRNKLKKK